MFDSSTVFANVLQIISATLASIFAADAICVKSYSYGSAKQHFLL